MFPCSADLGDVRKVLAYELRCISGLSATDTEYVHLRAGCFLQNASIK